MHQVRLSSYLTAEDCEELYFLALCGTRLGEAADQDQSSQWLVAGGLRQQLILDLLQQEDEDVDDVGPDPGRTVCLAESDQDIQDACLQQILQARRDSASPSRRLVLLGHQQLEHLVEMEGELGGLYRLTLELTVRPGGVVVEELVPVLDKIRHGRHIRSDNSADETEHGVTTTNNLEKLNCHKCFFMTSSPAHQQSQVI